MKKHHKLLSIFVLLSIFGAAVNAAPITFIFSGNVIDVTTEDPLIDTGVTVGAPVSYSILLDVDILGTQTTWDGTQYVTEELSTANFGVDTFYAEFLDGFLIDENLVATTPTPSLLNYGYALFGSTIFLGTQDHGLVINTIDGINWSATEQANDINGTPELISILSGGTLAAVPLPASFILMITGLIGLTGFIKIKK